MQNFNFKTKLLVALLGCASFGTAHATPVNYNEAVSGDIDTFTAATDSLGQPTRNFITLGVGDNHFVGSLSSGSGNDSSDVIPFTIDTGDTLTHLLVTVNDSIIISDSVIDLENTLGQLFAHSSLQNYSTDIVGGDPNFYSLLLGNGVVVTNYSVTLTVTGPADTSVPEPSAIALMVLGMAAMARSVRRRSI